jgi:iron complex transport system substrate-binding protein
MRRYHSLLLLAALAAALASGCRTREAPPPVPTGGEPSTTFPLTVVDSRGQSLTLPAPPRRIISLAPSLTEIVFALGLGDRLVGVTEFCKYPPEALKKEKIGGYVNASQEKIVSLRPDLVLATRGTPTGFMDGLRRNGLQVMAVDQTCLDDVLRSMVEIGRVCGAAEAGRKLRLELESARGDVLGRTGGLAAAQRPRALLVLSLEPLFVGGPGSFQSEMVAACGATEVSGLNKPFGALSEEAVVEADPEVIIFPSNDSGRAVTVAGQLERLRASAAWRNTSAVKSGRIIVINVDHLSIPGPRLALGFRELAQALHPELFTP